MYRRIDDFIEDWKYEESATLKIFAAITDKVKSGKSRENIRSLERLAWHITQTLTEMPARAGLINHDSLDEKPIPATFAEIISAYKKHSADLQNQLRAKWTDEGLTETVNMYGEPWEKRKMLSVLVMHQTHHRAQMTVLMRLQNLPVPGIYGPSKEEWGTYGMTAQE